MLNYFESRISVLINESIFDIVQRTMRSIGCSSVAVLLYARKPRDFEFTPIYLYSATIKTLITAVSNGRFNFTTQP